MCHQFTTGAKTSDNRASDNRASDKPLDDKALRGLAFAARRAQVAQTRELILTEGRPETHDDSTALCTHFKLRRGCVGGERAEAQVYSHAAGTVVRFWVYGEDFSVRVRDLVVLASSDKGAELWLEIDGKLFPHEGKYSVAGRQALSSLLLGR